MSSLKTFKDFFLQNKSKSEWDDIFSIVENAKENNMENILIEKEERYNEQTLNSDNHEMVSSVKHSDGNFAIKFIFTVDELEQEKLIKIETYLKDKNNNYFNSFIEIMNDCIRVGKKYKPSSELQACYIANDKLYRFFPSISINEIKFEVQANIKEDIFNCIKDIFECWSEKLDLELISFDAKILQWISNKMSNKLY